MKNKLHKFSTLLLISILLFCIGGCLCPRVKTVNTNPYPENSTCPSTSVPDNEFIIRLSDATTDIQACLDTFYLINKNLLKPDSSCIPTSVKGDTAFITESQLKCLKDPSQKDSIYRIHITLKQEKIDELQRCFFSESLKKGITLTHQDIRLKKACECRFMLFNINKEVFLNESVTQASSKTRNQDDGKPGKIMSVTTNNYAIDFPDVVDFTIPSYATEDGAERVSIASNIDPQRNDQQTVVAVIDSGLDFFHDHFYDTISSQKTARYWLNLPELNPAFSNRIAPIPENFKRLMISPQPINCQYDDLVGFDFWGNSVFPTDSLGHGTHVGYVIASANTTNRLIKVMPLKIGYTAIISPQKKEFRADLFSVKCALSYAIRNGADIVNMSLGYYAPKPDPDLLKLFSEAVDSNILIVTSAGNNGIDIEECHHWPSNFNKLFPNNVISVAALDQTSPILTPQLMDISNRSSFVDLAAPGKDIVSAIPGMNGLVKSMSGTSMAAAIISRQAAILMADSNPRLSAAQVKTSLLHNCLKDNDPNIEDRILVNQYRYFNFKAAMNGDPVLRTIIQ